MSIFIRQKRFAIVLLATLILASTGCGKSADVSPVPTLEPVVMTTDSPAPQSEPTPLPQPQLKYIFC